MDLPTPTVITLPDKTRIAVAGMRLTGLMSGALFRALKDPVGQGAYSGDAIEQARVYWTDLAHSLAISEYPLEFLLLLDNLPNPQSHEPEISLSFWAIGRSRNHMSNADNCRRAFGDLWDLVTSTLEYASFKPLDAAAARAHLGALGRSSGTEFRRRQPLLDLSLAAPSNARGGIPYPIGFREITPTRRSAAKKAGSLQVRHLFPWEPSDDPWRRMLTSLLDCDKVISFAIHGQSARDSSPAVLREAAERIVVLETAVAEAHLPEEETVLKSRVLKLLDEANRRLAVVERNTLCLRTFLLSEAPLRGSHLSLIQSSIDDASLTADARLRGFMHGDADRLPVNAADVLAPLDIHDISLLFGPNEATAILRTPLPSDENLPGIDIVRARTAVVRGASGADVDLGDNFHRSYRRAIRPDEEARFRHTYVVGQTGTGKSTLLVNMILQDIERGRGVCVIDPHGALVNDVLARFPAQREDDLRLFDLGAQDHVVPFNPLVIRADSVRDYRRQRDQIIDDILGYFDRVYDLRLTGGPMFETYFRAALVLLMGDEPPAAGQAPSLAQVYDLFDLEGLFEVLAGRMTVSQSQVRTFVNSALGAGGEISLKNMRPYITAKLTRFVHNTDIRNIIGQPRSLDFEELIESKSVLLVNLAKGAIGDNAAGLIASTLVSKFRTAAMRRGQMGKNVVPYYLYADEFQSFADRKFEEILAEARKFGISLTLAHQFVRQLPPEVLHAVTGNVGTIVAFRVGVEDAEHLEGLYAPIFNRLDLASQGNWRALVRGSGSLGMEPFSLATRAMQPGDPSRISRLRELSRGKIGVEIEEAENAVQELTRLFEQMAGVKSARKRVRPEISLEDILS